ncbi:hypothetical protein SteCoe_31208 [Stentor coeruleus]|uniref:Uncharacterized protein n=1 Tax=Stentor coeruleus TaxID=5963 RepID=A0A1R2B1Y2_9CILI|nr:hypothetical protein SteCoe_31208 [Stentor coeruleus]
MAEESVIPDYQIDLVRLKPSYGVALTSEEEAIVNSVPERPLHEYFVYKQKVRPEEFKNYVKEAKITPINNYRENFILSKLMIQAYNLGYTSNMSSSQSFEKFNSSYMVIKAFEYLRFFGGIALMGAFNYFVALPRYKSLGIFAYQNTALALTWYFSTTTFIFANNHLISNDLIDVALQNKNDLLRLKAEGKLIYNYPHYSEDFPPSNFGYKIHEFYSSKKKYDEAHKDDFNGINRRTSQYIYHKEHRNKLV